jgi:dTMP kinase
VARRIPARSGLFITLEGPDGAGKSSQSERLGQRLMADGADPVLTREPGGTGLGEQVRRLLLEGEAVGHDGISDALLFNAARRQLVSQVIAPALAADRVVVCDRFTDSTLAYQGYGEGAPLDILRLLAAVATDGLAPHRTLLFDLPPEQGLDRRLSGPQAEMTRFERSLRHDLDFHRRVRQGYLDMAAEEPDRWRVIDATRAPDDVAAEVWQQVRDLLAG